jgi:hypothetical protein
VAALVVGASLLAGVRALARDYDRAFHVAGKSVFPPGVARQVDAIRARVPAGASVLLLSASSTDGSWWARLFQRALYPRNPIVVRYEPLPSAQLARLRREWGLGWGLLLAPDASSLPFADREDLGTLPAMPDRVWLGPLTP